MSLYYNFRLAPEAVWLVVNTVLGWALVTLAETDFLNITDWRGWAIGFAIGLGRAIIGAVLAVASGGGFQMPGQPAPPPTPPTP